MFTTNDLRHFLEGLAILFSIGYWGTMLLLLWFLVRFAYKKPKRNPGKILSGSLTAAAILMLFVWIIPKQFARSKKKYRHKKSGTENTKKPKPCLTNNAKRRGKDLPDGGQCGRDYAVEGST